MANDILIGAADRYSWADVRPWVKSARASGFQGEIWLICYRVTNDVEEQAGQHGVALYEVDHDPYLLKIIHDHKGSPTQAHNLRFFHAWELLTRLGTAKYRWCIMTDARDVVFQRDPTDFLDHVIGAHKYRAVAASEGLAYPEEEWNAKNIADAFGPVYFDLVARKWNAFNVGTLGGDARFMAGLFHTIYSLTEGRSYPSDQAAFNTLMQGIISDYVFRANHGDAWAAQCGTTLDPTKDWLWKRHTEPRPVLSEGCLRTYYGALYSMVHQWDRVPELKKIIQEKYE